MLCWFGLVVVVKQTSNKLPNVLEKAGIIPQCFAKIPLWYTSENSATACRISLKIFLEEVWFLGRPHILIDCLKGNRAAASNSAEYLVLFSGSFYFTLFSVKVHRYKWQRNLNSTVPVMLMLLGWSLMWIASLTLRDFQWGARSINLTSSQSGNIVHQWE